MSNSPSRRQLPPGPSPSPSTAIHDAIRTTLPTTPANSGPEASSAGANSASRQQQGRISQGARNMRRRPGFERLPEDILHCIHSLLAVQDAARVACMSRGFLRAWRCYSHLVLNVHTLGLADKTIEEQEPYIIQKVDQILENHHKNGVKVETLKFILAPYRNIRASSLDRWLQMTAKSGIKELDLSMPLRVRGEYNFMCAILSDEAAASSIQSLRLYNCAFHPTSSLGVLRRLTCLHLCIVHVTEEGLGILLSKSSALEELKISFCRGIICLRIACALQHLKYIGLIHCIGLQSVQIDAPNLCSFHSDGIGILAAVRNSSQLKNVDLSSILLSDARARLPSIIRNVQSLSLHSCYEENVNITIPTLPSKFPHLKKLEIRLHQAAILFLDIFSLVSFLDAAPVLDSFILRVEKGASTPDLVSGDDYEYSRRKLEYRYDCLRQVLITGFYPSRSLVELTVHILESAPFLKRLTLDTIDGSDRRFVTASTKNGQYQPMSNTEVVGARRAMEVAGRCITRRVPTHVQFEVLEPCSHCHSVDP